APVTVTGTSAGTTTSKSPAMITLAPSAGGVPSRMSPEPAIAADDSVTAVRSASIRPLRTSRHVTAGLMPIRQPEKVYHDGASGSASMRMDTAPSTDVSVAGGMPTDPPLTIGSTT